MANAFSLPNQGQVTGLLPSLFAGKTGLPNATSFSDPATTNLNNGMSAINMGQKASSPYQNLVPLSNTLTPKQSANTNMNDGSLALPQTQNTSDNSVNVNPATGQPYTTVLNAPYTGTPPASPVIKAPTPVTTTSPVTPNNTAPTANNTPINPATPDSFTQYVGALANGSNSSEVNQANQNLQSLQSKNAALQAAVEGTQTDLSLAGGREGILNRLFATQQSAAQTAVQNALTEQGQGITALQGAVNATQPVTGVQYGTATILPGTVASGGANSSSALPTVALNTYVQMELNVQAAQIPSSITSNPLYQAQITQQAQTINPNFNWNTSLGQGTVQQSNAAVAGVAIPMAALNTYIQDYLTGNVGAIPSSVTGDPVLWAQVQKGAEAINPNINYNVQVGTGAAQQENTQTAGTSTVQANQQVYTNALALATTYGSYRDNIAQFGDQVKSNLQGLNPSQVQSLNMSVGQFLTQYQGNPQYATLYANIAGYQARVSQLLNTGEDLGTASAVAQQIVNGGMPMSQMSSVIDQINNEANVVVNNQAAVAQNAKNAINQNVSPTTVTSNSQGNNNSNSQGNNNSNINGQPNPWH